VSGITGMVQKNQKNFFEKSANQVINEVAIDTNQSVIILILTFDIDHYTVFIIG